MSVTISFGKDYFAQNIDGFEKARKYFASCNSKKRRESALPSKVLFFIIKCLADLNQFKVTMAVMKSPQLANANVIVSKKDTNDPDMKVKIDQMKAQHGNAIRKFLSDGSDTLILEFLEKRVTRKRSGMINYQVLLDACEKKFLNSYLKRLRHHMFLEEHNE